ncbi:phytanoyl-CoA dioxygenase family protein [Sphingomonas sp. G-3-2-10]|uniref:phytanoyl-CoA dioxygenase family protein n=1 Tax=Sphingomonas sp. G-3-2-10 TaxID=2728838 RepID=UPI00146A2245|nr:phytanoyl-CoA dioxygenase family protein [Sphingomonas sp. G-3-2-10]NML07392.1 phytanoyl-CoA dioxygenase family protein [Sphingomonas sp. G-3-2-10]
MNLDEHGAAHLSGAAAPFLEALETALAGQPADQAGIRLYGVTGLAAILDSIGSRAAQLAGRRPVRAILFDKSESTNWALGWHQDRTIAVRARAEMPGYGPWSIKAGLRHVEPPFALIERMLTIRIHLDSVDETNAPLLIAPGSHLMGRIPETEVEATIARCSTATCLADRGDIWLYATPILHASATATAPRHRRVLQVDYSADILPAPLEWLGI